MRFFIFIFIIVFIEAYAFKGLWLLTKNYSLTVKLIGYSAYWIFNLFLLYKFLVYMRTSTEVATLNPENYIVWMGIFIVFFFGKLFMSSFHLIDDVVYVFKWMGTKISIPTATEFAGEKISRSRFITQVGAGISLLAIGMYTYGIARGKYSFRVLSEKLRYKNLPDSFSGTKIVHISDLHLGSFANEIEKIAGVIDTINDLNPDYIFFTGDMVNNHSNEAEPWIETFAKLKAKEGKYSIFGNHDYCDYGRLSEEKRNQSVSRLKEIHKEMGFRLLEDEHVILEKNGEKMALLGTHNWGLGGFHTVGDLTKASKGLSDDTFQILLSHDPTQWEAKVMDQKEIDLTLSGHTHGMQMGLELSSLGIKFSPIQWRYKRWAGLYEASGGQKMYINRGFGVLGYPGRIGMPPEITLIELEKEYA